MLTFDKPKPTKSGRKVIEIWNELQDCWSKYKRAKLDSDLSIMREYASRIRSLQDDLGITQAEFPELKTESIKTS